LEAFGRALGARRDCDFNAEWPAAEAELASVFDGQGWGLSGKAEPYSEDNARNLWKNELSQPVRGALEARGIDQAAFKAWLGEIHYVYVAAHLTSLFEHYGHNKGWRVLAISIPAAGVAAVGIASHYQQGQKHNRLGEVSNLLYDQAAAGLAGKEVPWPGRKVAAEDWDGVGLMREPASEIAGVKLPAGQQARLKYVRTTTVKKILASFITIQPLDLSSGGLGEELDGAMAALEKAARALA
jgi:5-methylcytosine-specific restriction enzyme B